MCEDTNDIQTAYTRDAADGLLEAVRERVLENGREAFWAAVRMELGPLASTGDFPVNHEADLDAAMKQAITVYIALNI